MKAFNITNREIFALETDCNLSGSTCCTVSLKDKNLFCCNVGDSRAVLAK